MYIYKQTPQQHQINLLFWRKKNKKKKTNENIVLVLYELYDKWLKEAEKMSQPVPWDRMTY